MKKKNISFFQSKRLATLVIETWFIKNWTIENPKENFAEDVSRRTTRYSRISMLFVTCCIGDLVLLKSPQSLATLLSALLVTTLICITFLRARSEICIFANQIENWSMWQNAANILARKLSLEFVTFPALIPIAKVDSSNQRLKEALEYAIADYLQDAKYAISSAEVHDLARMKELQQESEGIYQLGEQLGLDVKYLVEHHVQRPLPLYGGKFWY